MSVAIVKYNAGNVRSMANALSRIGVDAVITDDPIELRRASHVIFPGVGEASSAMRYLRERGLDKVLGSLTRPLLGVCLGMQLACAISEENDTRCLGKIPESVRRFTSSELKVPHIGWNTITGLSSPLFDGVADGSYVYFVHGYYVETSERTIATCSYGVDFAAAIREDNFYGVQFHPEKSGAVGQSILENFLRI